MIVRGLRDGQVLSKVFRIEQQSLERGSLLQIVRVREDAVRNPANQMTVRVEIGLDRPYLL
jgi:hypothetical protein